MKIELIFFENNKNKFSNSVRDDVSMIITKMKKERIELTGWNLVEIPSEQTYCFYNLERKQAFDMEPNSNGMLVPHYYHHVDGSIVTKHPTKRIKEAIGRYVLK